MPVPAARYRGRRHVQECLGARLRSLRDDYGRDLWLVSSADRNALDVACSNTRQAEGREAYLECLTVQLVSIRNRRRERTTGGVAGAPLLSPPDPRESRASRPARSSREAERSSRVPVWIGVTLVALVRRRRRRVHGRQGSTPVRKCRACGADVPGRRRVLDIPARDRRDIQACVTERADHVRAQVAAQKRLTEREEELRRRRARDETALFYARSWRRVSGRKHAGNWRRSRKPLVDEPSKKPCRGAVGCREDVR